MVEILVIAYEEAVDDILYGTYDLHPVMWAELGTSFFRDRSQSFRGDACFGCFFAAGDIGDHLDDPKQRAVGATVYAGPAVPDGGIVLVDGGGPVSAVPGE